MRLLFKIFLLSIVSAVFISCGGGGGGADPVPGTLQFSAATYSGEEDAGAITVIVTRTGGSDGAVSVRLSDSGSGSATPGNDYLAIAATTLSWANGDSAAKTISVSPITDGSYEADETVILNLSNATGGASLGLSMATVNIINDDANNPGVLQFDTSSYSVQETGGTATITVTRSGGDLGAVSVDYATTVSGSTATEGAGNDYMATSGTLSWVNGESSDKTFTVTILDDSLVELPETINLVLSNVVGATLGGNNNAILTIISEDKFGVLRFKNSSFSVNENDGTVTDVITLERVDGSSGDVSVDVTDLGTGSATAADYTFTPVTVTWLQGDTSDKNVTITLIDDALNEGTKTVDLSLTDVMGGAEIGTQNSATIFIEDDEATATGELQFDALTYSVTEDGGSATITVTRINGTSGVASVDYATSGGSATAGSDYTAVSGSLSWAAGEGGAKTFTVSIADDVEVEADETINLTLSGASGAILGTPNTAILTIGYNDTNLSMQIGDGSYWVAFQDGQAGSWSRWEPSSGNIYDFPVTDTSGRFGVAFHRQETDGSNTVEKSYVIHATLVELEGSAPLELYNNPKYTVSGTLVNYIAGADLGGAYMHLTGSGEDNAPFTYGPLEASGGLRDFIAYQQVGTAYPNKVVVRRDVDITGNMNDMDVDFLNDPNTEVEDLDITPNVFTTGQADHFLEVYYSTDNGTSFNIADGSTPIEYPYMSNASLTEAGDVYSFQVSSDTDHKYRVRNVAADAGDPGDRDIGLGNLLALNGTVVNATETTGLTYDPDPVSLNGKPVFRAFQIDLDQSVNSGVHWQFKISAGWLGSATSYSYPDLPGISGYDPGWDMSDGVSVGATVSTATTQSGWGSLSLVIRKTTGRDSYKLKPESWTIAKKLAHNNHLRLDIAREFSTFSW